MGGKLSSKGCSEIKSIFDPSVISKREAMAIWHRSGIEVHEIYNILEILGHGHMGEVCIVARKKYCNNHNHRQHYSFPPTNIVDGSRIVRTTPPQKSNAVPTNDSNINSFSDLRRSSSSIMHEPSIEPCSFPINDTETKTLSKTSENEPPSSALCYEKMQERHYACKSVSTTGSQSVKDFEELLNEVSIMRDLSHPYILQLFEVYHTKQKLWLITELCTGGDLFARIDTNTETDIAVVLEQICRAVAYMHLRGVCHRDIKMENVLYEHSGAGAKVKLIDFGLSQKFHKGSKMLRACGTIYTVGPELILGNGCSEKSDIWSIGVVSFVLLSGGDLPFLRDIIELDDPEKRDRLLAARYTFGPRWKDRGVRQEAKNFTCNCLRRHPGVRMTIKEALEYLQSVWIPTLSTDALKEIRDDEIGTLNHAQNLLLKAESCNVHLTSVERVKSSHNETDVINTPTRTRGLRDKILNRKNIQIENLPLQGMQNFCKCSALKKDVLIMMAYTMDKSNLDELSDLFISIDTDGTGTISLDELKSAIRRMHIDTNGTKITDEAIKRLFDGIDNDHSGQVPYAEFLAAVAESQGLITMELLAEAFDRIDANGKGYILASDLRTILGKDYNEEIVNAMIEEAGYYNDGQVDYDGFLRLMIKEPAVEFQSLRDANDKWSVAPVFRCLEGKKELKL